MVVTRTASTGGITMVSRTRAATQAVAPGATRVVAAVVAQTLLGVTAVVSLIRGISRISALAGVAGRGVPTLREGGATSPSSSDELETTICRRRC